MPGYIWFYTAASPKLSIFQMEFCLTSFHLAVAVVSTSATQHLAKTINQFYLPAVKASASQARTPLMVACGCRFIINVVEHTRFTGSIRFTWPLLLALLCPALDRLVLNSHCFQVHTFNVRCDAPFCFQPINSSELHLGRFRIDAFY